MAASVESVKDTLANQTIENTVVNSALDDAAFFIDIIYSIRPDNTPTARYDILHKYYTAHLLFVSGAHRTVGSESTPDLSISYDNTQINSIVLDESSYFLLSFLSIIGYTDFHVSI